MGRHRGVAYPRAFARLAEYCLVCLQHIHVHGVVHLFRSGYTRARAPTDWPAGCLGPYNLHYHDMSLTIACRFFHPTPLRCFRIIPSISFYDQFRELSHSGFHFRLVATTSNLIVSQPMISLVNRQGNASPGFTILQRCP